MIEELDTVVLTHGIEQDGLKQDDIGAVVHCYKNGETFEVEFVNGEGKTVTVLTLREDDLKSYAFKN